VGMLAASVVPRIVRLDECPRSLGPGPRASVCETSDLQELNTGAPTR
jgi:hypothetical protein